MNWALLWSKLTKLEKKVDSGGSGGSGFVTIEIADPIIAGGEPTILTTEQGSKVYEAAQSGTPILCKFVYRVTLGTGDIVDNYLFVVMNGARSEGTRDLIYSAELAMSDSRLGVAIAKLGEDVVILASIT